MAAPAHVSDILGEIARQVARLCSRIERDLGLVPGAAGRVASERALGMLAGITGRLALCRRLSARARAAELGGARRDLLACRGLLLLAARLGAPGPGSVTALTAGLDVLDRRLATLQAQLGSGKEHGR